MISGTITGRLGQDPELKHLDDGTPVLELSIASDGFKKDETTWVRASLFGKRAEKIAEFLGKGDRIAAAGTLALRTYTKRDGEKGASLEMRISEIDLIQDKREAPAHQAPQGRPAPAPRGPARPARPAAPERAVEEDDIPF